MATARNPRLRPVSTSFSGDETPSRKLKLLCMCSSAYSMGSSRDSALSGARYGARCDDQAGESPASAPTGGELPGRDASRNRRSCSDHEIGGLLHPISHTVLQETRPDRTGTLASPCPVHRPPGGDAQNDSWRGPTIFPRPATVPPTRSLSLAGNRR